MNLTMHPSEIAGLVDGNLMATADADVVVLGLRRRSRRSSALGRADAALVRP